MATLSAPEIFGLAIGAGFDADQAVTMTAIALAESGGDTDAHDPSGGSSRGLWQINDDPASGNEWGDVTDPEVNARAAFQVSGGGTDIRPWTVTHASEAGSDHDYRRFLDEARAAADEQHAGGGPSDTLRETIDPDPAPVDTDGNPSSAHVAISLGDGRSVEADGDAPEVPEAEVAAADPGGRSEVADGSIPGAFGEGETATQAELRAPAAPVDPGGDRLYGESNGGDPLADGAEVMLVPDPVGDESPDGEPFDAQAGAGFASSDADDSLPDDQDAPDDF